MYKSLINRIKNIHKNKQLLLICFAFFLIPWICFFAGCYNVDSFIELAAVNVSSYAITNTQTGYVSIQISPNNEESKKLMPNTYDEYFYWKYIFRHSDFSFLSTVNGAKTNLCFYDEINCDENITFIYCGNNSNQSQGDYYKHEVYDISFMFKGKNIIADSAINFFAISQTRADELLLTRGEKPLEDNKFVLEQYDKLLGTNTSLLIDGVHYCFTISNIYFEEGNLHENVSANFGEYVVSYIHFPDILSVESTYIFNSYDYQNIHKIKRIRTIFEKGDFSYYASSFTSSNKITKHSNVFDIDIFDVKVMDNFPLMVFLTILSYLLFILFSIGLIIFDKIHTIKSCLFIMLFFIVPYVILSTINSLHKIPLLFSYYSLLMYVFMLTFLLFVFLFILFIKGGKEKRKI